VESNLGFTFVVLAPMNNLEPCGINTKGNKTPQAGQPQSRLQYNELLHFEPRRSLMWLWVNLKPQLFCNE